MLEKLKNLKSTLSDKTKLLFYVAAAIIVLISCSVLPLAFRGEVITDNVFDTGERAVMFAKYISKDNSVRYKTDDKPEKSEIKYCSAVLDKIVEEYRIDNVSGKTITEGSDFLVLSDGENSMRVCRMWVQDQGDWTNWIDVYIDADTGFIYSLYISSICMYNGNDYYSAIEGDFNAKTVADLIAKETGFELKVLNWSGKAEDTATAYTAMNGEAIIWNINCSYYASSMLDVKICVA